MPVSQCVHDIEHDTPDKKKRTTKASSSAGDGKDIKVGANLGVKMVLVCRLELGHSLCLYLQKGILEKKKKKEEEIRNNWK